MSDQPADSETYTIIETKVCPICEGTGEIDLPISECSVMKVLRKDWDYLQNSGNEALDDCARFVGYIEKLVNVIRKHNIESDLVDDIVKELNDWAEDGDD